MDKSLILISRKPVVIQIFKLICKKLNISIEISQETQVDHKVDIIVVDNEFIDDRFNILKTYTKIIGAISKNELPFEKANDFLIPVPFLPSTLESIITKQIEVLNKRSSSKMYISNVEVDDTISNDELEDEEDYAVEYLEELADDIAQDMDEETDDSIVSFATLNNGGILDTKELSNIKEMINPLDDVKEEDEENSENEWKDLSSIIDEAIDEANTVNEIYSKFEHKPIKVLLNNYDIEELSPLLALLNQDIIDSLTEGYEVNLQLKLGKIDD